VGYAVTFAEPAGGALRDPRRPAAGGGEEERVKAAEAGRRGARERH
jgi:hypothetical protein